MKLTRSKIEYRKAIRWKSIFWAFLIIIICIIGYFTYQGIGIYQSLGDLHKTKEESLFKNVITTEEIKPPEWTGTERVNILLLGGDARGLKENQVPRSDSILVVSIDPVAKTANLFSVLRDTYVKIPDHSSNRINTALTFGGPELAMKTVGNLLNLDIQYYVYADFEGFKSLIDSIGGIEINVEKDMYYIDNADGNRYDIDLKKGFQHLDGSEALQYVRFRYDATSDFTRTERQRKFLSAVAKELQSAWNLLRMKQIIESVTPYIETNIDRDSLLKLAVLGKNSQVGEAVQLPPMDQLKYSVIGGAQVLTIRDENKLKEYVRSVLRISPPLNH